MNPHQLHCETEKGGLLGCFTFSIQLGKAKQNIVSYCFKNTGFDWPYLLIDYEKNLIMREEVWSFANLPPQPPLGLVFFPKTNFD